MENCFVKNLKVDFQNDELPRFGVLTFNIKNAPLAGWLSSYTMHSGTGVVSYSDGGYVTTGSGSDTKASDTKNVGTSNTNVYSCSGSYKLFFDDGYNLEKISFAQLLTDNISFDISPLKYRTHATDIRITASISNQNQGNLVGNVSTFSSLTNLTVLTIAGSHNIIGNISVLKDLTQLTILSFKDTKVEGTYESLLSAMSANRTSGSMILDCRNSDVTLHSISVGNVRHTVVFSATGCEVQPYNGGTAIATYTKATDTWTYA